jgi:hypothetical protein
MIEARMGGGVEAPQEGRAQCSDRDRHRREDHRPAQDGRGMMMLGADKGREIQGIEQIAKRSAHDSSLQNACKK